MSLFNELLTSNYGFFGALNNKKRDVEGTLLFDVMIQEKSIVYGVAKTALFISKIKKLLY